MYDENGNNQNVMGYGDNFLIISIFTFTSPSKHDISFILLQQPFHIKQFLTIKNRNDHKICMCVYMFIFSIYIYFI